MFLKFLIFVVFFILAYLLIRIGFKIVNNINRGKDQTESAIDMKMPEVRLRLRLQG